MSNTTEALLYFVFSMKDACPEHVDWLHALGHEYSCLRCIDQHLSICYVLVQGGR